VIYDLFAGPGGWDEALHRLGRKDAVGVEKEKNALATRAAAGHRSSGLADGDVARIDPSDLIREHGDCEGLIASPPCQDFSPAGLKRGLNGIRGQMVWQPLRYIEAMNPEWIAMEQVKEVLPLWKLYEEWLRERGYHTWSGMLDAADFGVPQRRRRAILRASRRAVGPPEPTHGDAGMDDLFGAPRAAHVTMAEALGWTGREIILDSRGDGGDGEWKRSAWFTSDRPSRTLGEKARSWVVIPPPGDCPEWPYKRPATTVVGSFRPDIMAAPDWRKDPSVPRQKQPGSVPITIEQALILQDFAVNYPIQGARTRAFEQIGNAIPPGLGIASLKGLL
jgi:DNA (cytosine-5)-methyltransferase 1